jgi:lysophospholipase L1-like esterase
MIDCIVLGDSIAVGTQLQRPECVSYAKVGITSSQWNKMYSDKNLNAGTVIISLGTNDHRSVKTDKELLAMRAKIKASRVFWILPVGNSSKSGVPLEVIQHTVREIAIQYGDIVLPITGVQKDGIHPSGAGYRQLAEATK